MAGAACVVCAPCARRARAARSAPVAGRGARRRHVRAHGSQGRGVAPGGPGAAAESAGGDGASGALALAPATHALAASHGEARDGMRKYVSLAAQPGASASLPDRSRVAGGAVAAAAGVATAAALVAWQTGVGRRASNARAVCLLWADRLLRSRERDLWPLPRAVQREMYAAWVLAARLAVDGALREMAAAPPTILGHPLCVCAEMVPLEHSAPKAAPVDNVMLRGVIAELIEADDAIFKGGVVWLPAAFETQLYANALALGLIAGDDAVLSLCMRFLGHEVAFYSVGGGEAGVRPNTGRQLALSDAAVKRAAAELQPFLPPVVRLLPRAADTFVRLSVAITAQVLNSVAVQLEGGRLALRLEETPTDGSSDATPPARAGADGAISGSALNPVVEAYVDRFFEKRGGISSAFISRQLERDTYVALLSGLFAPRSRVLGGVLGLDVLLLVEAGESWRVRGWAPREPLVERRDIERAVDWLLADPLYNIAAVPDNIERLLYVRSFELVLVVFEDIFSQLEVGVLGHAFAARIRRAAKATDYSSLRAFAPDSNLLRELASGTTSLEPVQDVLCNVYSFFLAVCAQALADTELNMLGRRMRLSLGRPPSGAPPQLPPRSDESRSRLQKALDALAGELVAAAKMEAASSSWRDSALRSAKQQAAAYLDIIAKVLDRPRVSENAPLLSAMSKLLAGFAVELRREPAVVADEVFRRYRSLPDNAFPFPYLPAREAESALRALWAEVSDLPPPRALAALAEAADVNGDGVVQYGEWAITAADVCALAVRNRR